MALRIHLSSQIQDTFILEITLDTDMADENPSLRNPINDISSHAIPTTMELFALKQSVVNSNYLSKRNNKSIHILHLIK